MSASSDYLRVLTDIQQQKGATQAATQRANSQIWGSSVAKLGDFASDAIKGYVEDKQAKQAEQKAAQEEQTLRELFSGDQLPTPTTILQRIGPVKGIPIINGLAALQKLNPQDDEKTRIERMSAVYRALDQFPEDQRATAFPAVIDPFEKIYGVALGDDKTYTPEKWKAIGAALKVTAPEKTQNLMNVPPGGAIFDPSSREKVFENPYQMTPDQQADNARLQAQSEQAAKDRVTAEARMTDAQKETVRHNRAMEARPVVGGGSPKDDAALIGSVMANPDLFYNLTPSTRERIGPALAAKGFKDFGPAPSGMERMDARKFGKAAPVLDAVGELSEKINTQQGVIAKISGGIERAKAQANLNDDVAEYQALISGFTPLVARALGHTGVLTQQDVDSVKALFPNPGDSKSLRDRKIARLKSIVGQLEQQDQKGGGSTTPPPASPEMGLSYQDYLKSKGGK